MKAARLLRSSILKIEQSDIELEDLAPVPNFEHEDAENEQQQQHDGEDAVMADADG